MIVEDRPPSAGGPEQFDRPEFFIKLKTAKARGLTKQTTHRKGYRGMRL